MLDIWNAHETNRHVPRESLESLGISAEINSRLNTIAAPIRVWHVNDTQLGEVHIGLVNIPFGGVYLADMLNSIAITYPDEHDKGYISVGAIEGDHILPSEAEYFGRGLEELHRMHLYDPQIGPHYEEFTTYHAEQWLRAEQKGPFDDVYYIARKIVEQEVWDDVSRTNRQFQYWRSYCLPITEQGVKRTAIRIKQMGDVLDIQHLSHLLHIRIRMDGKDFFYIKGSMVGDEDLLSIPVRWRMEVSDFPISSWTKGLRPLLAWRKNDGERTFLSQQEVMGVLSEFPLLYGALRNTDVFLGRSYLGYLSPQITSRFTAWHMKLGGKGYFQEIGASQAPVWLSLKQHALPLLNNDNPVVEAIEQA